MEIMERLGPRKEGIPETTNKRKCVVRKEFGARIVIPREREKEFCGHQRPADIFPGKLREKDRGTCLLYTSDAADE